VSHSAEDPVFVEPVNRTVLAFELDPRVDEARKCLILSGKRVRQWHLYDARLGHIDKVQERAPRAKLQKFQDAPEREFVPNSRTGPWPGRERATRASRPDKTTKTAHDWHALS
jgi:hypothetical protein